MPGGHDTTIEVSNIMSFVLYTQILKQSVLKPASPGITLNSLSSMFKFPQLLSDDKTVAIIKDNSPLNGLTSRTIFILIVLKNQKIKDD